MRRRGVLLAVVVAALLLGCAARPPAVDPGPWQAPVGREHPLVGRIWDARAQRFVSTDEVVAGLAAARYVLLGERHDNPDHHRLQAALLRALIGAGRRPAVVFEMFTTDDTAAIARYLAASPRDASGLAAAVDWQRSGWPDWAYYEPIAQGALDAELPVIGGNLTPATVRAVARGNSLALPSQLVARYALDRPLPDGGQAALTTEIHEAHCGTIPAERMEAMVLAQRARDAMLADSMLSGARDGALLIAGTGHVRADRGVPAYLRAREPRAVIAVVAPVEVRDGWTRPADYTGAAGGRPPYDWIWFTPRMGDGDPCESFRRPPATPGR
jgi:uncharacterized iron-regulated protein